MFNMLNGIEVVVFDFDGTAQNEIENSFDRKLLRGGTVLSNAFREFIVLSAMSLAKNRAAKQIDKSLDPEAVSLMKRLLSKGVLVLIRTSNPVVDTASIKQKLDEVGLFNVLVERVKDSEKGNDVNGVLPLLVGDGPEEALYAARKGCKVILLRKTYNGIRSLLINVNKLNPITIVNNLSEAGVLINSMPLSCNIESRQRQRTASII